jgi:polyferredoxin
MIDRFCAVFISASRRVLGPHIFSAAASFKLLFCYLTCPSTHGTDCLNAITRINLDRQQLFVQ